MAYDETLAARVRSLLEARPGYSERKMFGGLCFMINGNMACGIVKDELMVRLSPEAYLDALSRPHARPMDFTGRPAKGMVYVGANAITDDAALADWVQRGCRFRRVTTAQAALEKGPAGFTGGPLSSSRAAR